jgi:BRCT domain type II-containing protein
MARKGSEGEATATVLDVMEITGVLKGKSFSITGHMGLPRDQVVAIIEKAGGTFHKTPTYFTTFLVTNSDWNSGSTIASGTSRKLEAAKRNGTKIISEAALYDMITKLSEEQNI